MQNDGNEKRYGTIEQAMYRYSVGSTNMRRLAKLSGAEVRIGRKVLVNFVVLDSFFEQMAAREAGNNAADKETQEAGYGRTADLVDETAR